MNSYGYTGYYATPYQAHSQGQPPQFHGGAQPPAPLIHHHELDGVEMKIADKFQLASKVISSLGLMDINEHQTQIADLQYSFDLEKQVLEQNGDKRKKMCYDGQS